MPPEVPNRDKWFPTPDALPQPDWRAINAWLRETVTPAQHDEATGVITNYWLTRLASALGSQYSLSSGEYYVVLSDLAGERQQQMNEFLDKISAHVLQNLGESAALAPVRQWVIIRLPDMDTNFTVMPTLDGGGEAAEDAGEFFGSSSYPFVYCAEGVSDGEFASLVWPLIYHILGHLPLPAWLRVGLTTLLEADFSGNSSPPIEAATVAEHRTRWNACSIQEFWSGRFLSDVMWQDLFMSLAPALFDVIKRQSSSDPGGLQRFLCEANAKDSGEAAAQHVFRRGLATYLTVLLGPGDWTPHPEDWKIHEIEA